MQFITIRYYTLALLKTQHSFLKFLTKLYVAGRGNFRIVMDARYTEII